MSLGNSEVITDEMTRQHIMSALNQHVNLENYPHLLIRRKPMWRILPFPSSDHLDSNIQTRLVQILESTSQEVFYAVLAEKLSDIPSMIKYSATVEGVFQFDLECALYNYVIFSLACDWIIICTKYDYLLVLGDDEFIQMLLGISYTEAVEEFIKLISDLSTIPNLQSWLQQVLTKTTFISELPVDTWLEM